jgi:hypothetical protein
VRRRQFITLVGGAEGLRVVERPANHRQQVAELVILRYPISAHFENIALSALRDGASATPRQVIGLP